MSSSSAWRNLAETATAEVLELRIGFSIDPLSVNTCRSGSRARAAFPQSCAVAHNTNPASHYRTGRRDANAVWRRGLNGFVWQKRASSANPEAERVNLGPQCVLSAALVLSVDCAR